MSGFVHTHCAQQGWRRGTQDERRGAWTVSHRLAEAVSWNSRVGAGGREEAAEETMARDICHAWLHSPSLTIGPGDQPVVAFFSLPSFPGTLLPLTMGLLSPPRFLPTFNPSSLLLFLPLSVSTTKQNIVETTTIHSPPSASVFHYDFWLHLWLCCVVCISVWRPSLNDVCEREDTIDSCMMGLRTGIK